jgi:hypothetical protein
MSRNNRMMLTSAVKVRRMQRQFVYGNPEYEQALASGIKAVQRDYGEKLVTVIKVKLERRMWMHATRDIVALIRYYPGKVLLGPIRRLQGLAVRTKAS